MDKENKRLKYLISKTPKEYYVDQCALWYKNICIEINYKTGVGYDLDYIKAFEKLLNKLRILY